MALWVDVGEEELHVDLSAALEVLSVGETMFTPFIFRARHEERVRERQGQTKIQGGLQYLVFSKTIEFTKTKLKLKIKVNPQQ